MEGPEKREEFHTGSGRAGGGRRVILGIGDWALALTALGSPIRESLHERNGHVLAGIGVAEFRLGLPVAVLCGIFLGGKGHPLGYDHNFWPPPRGAGKQLAQIDLRTVVSPHRETPFLRPALPRTWDANKADSLRNTLFQ